MAFASQAGPARVNKNQEEVATSHPVGKAFLSRRTVARHVENVTEHRFAHLVVGGVIAGGMPDRNRLAVEPAHLTGQPMLPLRPQLFGISSQADNLVAGKDNEVWRWNQPPDNRVDGGKGPLVEPTRNAGARVPVQDELMPSTTRHQGGDPLERLMFRRQEFLP